MNNRHEIRAKLSILRACFLQSNLENKKIQKLASAKKILKKKPPKSLPTSNAAFFKYTWKVLNPSHPVHFKKLY